MAIMFMQMYYVLFSMFPLTPTPYMGLVASIFNYFPSHCTYTQFSGQW